jgi:hypothetical protein
MGPVFAIAKDVGGGLHGISGKGSVVDRGAPQGAEMPILTENRPDEKTETDRGLDGLMKKGLGGLHS